MAKRERDDDPRGVCGHHYQNHDGGEPCSASAAPTQITSFPAEILPNFLYLGSYSDACSVKLIQSLGISCILNTVPSCENLNLSPLTFTYHRLQDEKALEFDNAIRFLEACEIENSRVLVHCISGRNRSPAIVVAYLMKRKGWRLAKSYYWIKQRRPFTDISPEFQQQLKEFEERLFGSRNQLSTARLGSRTRTSE